VCAVLLCAEGNGRRIVVFDERRDDERCDDEYRDDEYDDVELAREDGRSSGERHRFSGTL
jgi:hypothetical protein